MRYNKYRKRANTSDYIHIIFENVTQATIPKDKCKYIVKNKYIKSLEFPLNSIKYYFYGFKIPRDRVVKHCDICTVEINNIEFVAHWKDIWADENRWQINKLDKGMVKIEWKD